MKKKALLNLCLAVAIIATAIWYGPNVWAEDEYSEAYGHVIEDYDSEDEFDLPEIEEETDFPEVIPDNGNEEQAVEGAVNLPREDYIAITPANMEFFTVGFTLTTADAAQRRGFGTTGYYAVTNPSRLEFTHTQDGEGVDRYFTEIADVESFGDPTDFFASANVDWSSLIPHVPAEFVDFEPDMEEGFYLLALRAGRTGFPDHLSDAATVFVNIQRTGSYIDINNGNSNLHQDSSLCPSTHSSVRCDSEGFLASNNPVRNATTVSIGRPANYERHGILESIMWSIVNDAGVTVLEGTGPLEGFDVSRWPIGLYTVEVTVTETTADGFPNDPGLISTTVHQFVVEPPTLTKTASVMLAEVGDTYTYTLTVNNPNSRPLHYISVVDRVPVELVDFVPGTVQVNGVRVDDGFDGTYLTVWFDTLDSGETTITFDVIVREEAQGEEIINVAHLYGPSDVDEETGNPVPDGGRRPIDDDDAIVRVPYPPHLLDPPSLTKEANRETANVGDTIKYTLTVNNPNNVNLFDFVVVDNILTNLVTFQAGTVQVNGVDADYSFVDGQLRIYLEVLPVGDTVITFDVVVLPTAAGLEIPNIAYLYGPPTIDEETGEEVRRPVSEDDAIVRVPTSEQSTTTTTTPTPTTRPPLPQTGSVIANITLVGVALANVGAVTAIAKRNRKNK